MHYKSLRLIISRVGNPNQSFNQGNRPSVNIELNNEIEHSEGQRAEMEPKTQNSNEVMHDPMDE